MFEDTKERSCQSKDREYNGQKQMDKRTKMIYTTIYRKQNIEQFELHWKPGVNSGVTGGSQFLSTSGTRRVIAKRHKHHAILKLCWTPGYVNK